MNIGGYVYILSNHVRGTLYVGVTADLARRMDHHRTGHGSEFVKKYRCHSLVWFETFDDIETAIVHEKRLKRWRRQWKFNLIERMNPEWEDLSTLLHVVPGERMWSPGSCISHK